MSDTDSTTERLADGEAVLRTFLIADVRGYTSFTQAHGDEMAAALAGRFADITREHVGANGGRVIELRGGEALAVFASARPTASSSTRPPAIPLVIPQNLDFLSSRVGNYQNNPGWGVLIDQLRVQ